MRRLLVLLVLAACEHGPTDPGVGPTVWFDNPEYLAYELGYRTASGAVTMLGFHSTQIQGACFHLPATDQPLQLVAILNADTLTTVPTVFTRGSRAWDWTIGNPSPTLNTWHCMPPR